MAKTQIHLDLGLLGEDVPVAVEYDYQPAERGDRFYPGCDEGAEINSAVATTDDGQTIDLMPVINGNMSIELEVEELVLEADWVGKRAAEAMAEDLMYDRMVEERMQRRL